MSDTILSGAVTVWYSSDQSRKQIKWSGTATATITANALYSALQDLFDEVAQLDDGVPMSAQTPTEYTIGAIDASDVTPWFIDDETIQHITGGAIKTRLWTRITGSQAGIVKLKYANTSNTIAYGDIGKVITQSVAGTSTGTLLDFQDDGTNITLYVRPATSAAGDDFATGTCKLTVTAGGVSHGTSVATTSSTGDPLWANIYSLGSLTTDTGKNPTADLYVYRDGAKVRRWVQGAGTLAYQWWPTSFVAPATGHIDILMKVKEPGATTFTADTHTNTVVDNLSINAGLLRIGQPIFGAGIPAGATVATITSRTAITISAAATATTASVSMYANTIDGAYVTVFAREFDTTYDYFAVDLNSGGRNPIPLATGSDLNNAVGLRQNVVSAGSGTFQVGEIIYTGATLATSTARAVVTRVTGSAGAQTLRYYLIGDLTELTATDVKGAVSAATGTAGVIGTNADLDGASVFVNPASFVGAGLGVTFGTFTDDINNGNGTKSYAIKIDPGANTYSLAKMYEWTKFITRRGSVSFTLNNGANGDTAGINGERYIGAETILTVGAGTAYSAGVVVHQASSGSYGTVISHSAASYCLLRNVRGTFDGAGSITDGSTTITVSAVNTFTPIKANPFGTFAGGKFFAAPGVMFNRANLAAADIQAYQLTALDATTQVPPNIVSVSITGLLTGDAAGVFQTRTTAGIIDRAAYTMPTVAASGGTTLAVTNGTRTAIATDEPTAGFIRLVKTISAGITQEHRYRYASWTAQTFTFTAVTTGQGAALTATVAAYWNSQTNAAATGGNLLRVTLGTAISAAGTAGVSVFTGDMVFTAASGTPTTTIANGSIVKIEDTTHIWVRVNGTVTLADWSGIGNVIAFNKLATTYANTDKLYVPIIDTYIASGTSVSNNLIYSADFAVQARVRAYRTLLPFEQTATVGSTGLSISAIRSADSIAV